MARRSLAITTALAGFMLCAAWSVGAAGQPGNRIEMNPGDARPAPGTPGAEPPITMPSPAVEAPEDESDLPGDATTDRAIARVDARDLIGAELKSAEGEEVGEVEAVYLDQQGEVRSVIVGIGGLLGFGERRIALGWNALDVADDGQTVNTTLTKDDLKAIPEYRYADNSYRGKLFNDNGIVTN